MKAYIIEFPIGGTITDGEKLLFDNTDVEAKYVLSNTERFQTSSPQSLEWQLKCSTVITEEQREAIAELRDAVKQLESEGWEFDEGAAK